MEMARQSTSRGLYLAYRNFSTMTDNTDTYDFVGYTDIRILTNELEPC